MNGWIGKLWVRSVVVGGVASVAVHGVGAAPVAMSGGASGVRSVPVWVTEREAARLDTGVTTDTGDLAPVSVDYRRGFGEPLACVAAARWVQRVFTEGTLAAQAQWDARVGLEQPSDDTLSTAARATARACGARFTLATTPPAQWPDLFTLALLAGEDTAAHAVLTQLLARAGSADSVRAAVLSWAVQQYVAARPARLAAAEGVTTQLDAMPEDGRVQVQQGGAHAALFGVARTYTSWPLMERYGTTWIVLGRRQMGEPDKLALWGVRSLLKVYRQLLEGASVEAPDSVAAIAKRLRAEFYTPAAARTLAAACTEDKAEVTGRNICGLSLTATTPVAQITSALLSPVFRARSSAPPLEAEYWFPPPGHPEGDTIRPAPGRVSLIYHWVGMLPGGCEDAWDHCRPETNVMQALLAHYGDRLAGTVVVDAAGFTVLHVPASTAAVAESYRWYFQKFLGLPVAVAVRVRPVVERRPPPDGRIIYGAAPASRDVYGRHVFVVTDWQQRVVYQVPGIGAGNSGVVSRLNHVIAWVEAQP